MTIDTDHTSATKSHDTHAVSLAGTDFSGAVVPKPPGYLLFTLGVVYPTAVLWFELATGMCAEVVFDPIPTMGHVALVAAVPLANLAAWLWLRGKARLPPKIIGALNGLAMGVAAYYSLRFLPMYPFALLALISGIGLLPFGPPASLLAAAKLRSFLKKSAIGGAPVPGGRPRVPGTIMGALFFVCCLGLLEVRPAITWLAAEASLNAESPAFRRFGLKTLRAVGDENLLRDLCYQETARPFSGYGLAALVSGRPMQVSEVRDLYFRVTGKPFNEAPQPKLGVTGRYWFGRARWDMSQGERTVSGKIEGLSAASSQIDGSVDAQAALAYLEWDLVFKNQSQFQQEARAVVALPPGGVVSRLTLWVNGEEREAVFGARGKVTEAYTKVVRRKRDPVLITTLGPDRIFMQCFPVPPRGGDMRVRIGITCPLEHIQTDSARLSMPLFLERNFNIPPEVKHAVWIESKKPLQSGDDGWTREPKPDGASVLRGELSDETLMEGRGNHSVDRAGSAAVSWTEDAFQKEKGYVLQNFTSDTVESPDVIILVVDGAASMGGHRKTLVDALHRLPESARFGLVVAGDALLTSGKEPTRVSPEALLKGTKLLTDHRFVGGVDNTAALIAAMDLARSGTNPAVIWIHGPQPLPPQGIGVLGQRLSRAGKTVRLYDLQFRAGPNRIMESMDPKYPLKIQWRVGKLEPALDNVLEDLKGSGARLTPLRNRVETLRPEGEEGAHHTSDHLARLWAFEQVMGLLARGKKDDVARAQKQAVAYRLVTPVTGAVVLESDADYTASGLKPPEPYKVPTIPEPETWVIIMACAVLLLVFVFRRHRGGASA